MADPHPPQHHDSSKSAAAALVSNILAFAGFAVLAIIVIWGLVHIASLSSGWFGNLFPGSPAPARIEVRAPERALSGHAALLTWQHQSDGGQYAFLYECTTGLEFGIPIVKNGETAPTLARVPCGTAFTLGNATSSLIVVPLLASSTELVAHLNIVYVPTQNGAQASGSAVMTIARGEESTAPTGETHPTQPEQPAPVSGPADLAVTINAASTDPSGYSVVTFTIANVGRSSTGTYRFSANLPTAQAYTYVSDPQASLAPGDSIVNTLRFTQTSAGVFFVTVDPSNAVVEQSESNNTASQQLYRY